MEVIESNLVTGATTTLGSFVVSAGAPINLNDGLTITFDAETPTFGTFTDSRNGSYAGAVTNPSLESNFIGERGDGEYGIVSVVQGPQA